MSRFTILKILSIVFFFALVLHSSPLLAAGCMDQYQAVPPFITADASPKVMLVMSRNHKLFNEAYNDASDLNGDGVIDVNYKPKKIDYYGYFDSYKCYEYDSGAERFVPRCDSQPDTKTCNSGWSGDFLNYLTMSRMDALRKVLYGGKRSTDWEDTTVLERAYIPQDAHSWGKSYNSKGSDDYDISDYSPLNQPEDGKRHLFASTTLDEDGDGDGSDDPPLLRVEKNSNHEIWEWVAKERPVCGNEMANDDGSEETVDIDQDYTVRVEVGKCSESDTSGVYSGSMSYPNSTSPKPVGLLQRYGKDGDMHFGLLTGSYTNNISGGVLRKNIGSFEDEIDQSTGEFTDSKGIIYTIDSLRIINFDYSGYSYDGGRYADGPMPTANADFPDWGNPLAEMLYEALNYYGDETKTSSFTYTGDDGDELDLPQPDWENPYNSTDYCAEAHILTISDIYPNFDSDEVPGAKYEWRDSGVDSSKNIGDAAEDLDAEKIGDEIFNKELGSQKNRFIGCSGIDDCDYSCEDKKVGSLGNIRGLCPDEPTRQGSYYSASVAHYARTNDLSSVQGNQTITNYMVALSSPRPRIEIPVMDGKVTVVPFAKSVGGSHGIHPGKDDYQPTDTIVDYFVENITPTSGSFRINFEDVEQAADYDMDAIVRYKYQLVDSNGDPVDNTTAGSEVKISLESEYAAGSIIQHLGYIISGTQSDDTYLVVRDADTAADNDVDYFLDKPKNASWDDDEALPLSHEKTFEPSSTEAATTLKNPLWYAAKWGGFDDSNDNGVPDEQVEWDADEDGEPDTYFYVQNPLQLEKQLNQAFMDIQEKTSSGTSVTTVRSKTTTGSVVGQAAFYPERQFENDRRVNWVGDIYSNWSLNAYIEGDVVQNIREDFPDPNYKLDVEKDQILEYNLSDDGNLVIDAYTPYSNGTKDSLNKSYNSLDEVHHLFQVGSKLQNRDASDRLIWGVSSQTQELQEFEDGNVDHFKEFLGNATECYPDCLLDSGTPDYKALINYMRGESINGCRSRKTGSGTWKLGDILYSTPKTVKYEDEGYSLLFAGANDGMLHAFRMGYIKSLGEEKQPTQLCEEENDCSTSGQSSLGKEEWAFIPKAAMPYLRYMADPDYPHAYTVDQTPYIIETKNKKYLIGGMRLGGGTADGDTPPPSDTQPVGRSAYFALDITDPQNPEYLWSFSPDGLGYSYSGPAYVKRKDSSGNWQRYVMFASGPTSVEGTSEQPLKMYTVDLENGPNGPNGFNATTEPLSELNNAFGGRLFTDGLDLNDDKQTDYVLMGYTNDAVSNKLETGQMDGGLIKIYTGNSTVSEWEYDKYVSSINTPVTAPVGTMPCFPENIEYPYLFFGTGRYFTKEYSQKTKDNYLYGVPFTCDASGSCDIGTINSVTNSNALECPSDVDNVDENSNQAGWKIKLDAPVDNYLRERCYSEPATTDYNIVFFNTAMPNAEVCGYGGRSRTWALNCATGWAATNDTCKYSADVEDMSILVQLSEGNIKTPNLSDSFTKETGRSTDWFDGLPPEDPPVPKPNPDLGSGHILYWKEW